MQSGLLFSFRKWFITAVFFIAVISLRAQISETISAFKFGPFNVTSARKQMAGKYILSVSIFKGSTFILCDSVITDAANCQGFSFPADQPLPEYFIFSKHQKKAGRTYILSRNGDFGMIGGGTFWAAPKHKLLFILAEKDYRNLVVFDLKQMKTVFEKYSCDEFTDWYYRKGSYFGNVSTECGDELRTEKEVSEWMHPVEIEQFDIKRNTLNEMHISNEQLEHAKPLIKYAFCK